MRTLVWFRGKDLRVRDHQALYEASKAGEVIPCFVVDPYFFSKARACELPHRMQFLIQSLQECQGKASRRFRALHARGRSTASSPTGGSNPLAGNVTAE
jgi:deoxyribodipyrimidine photo-lyase